MESQEGLILRLSLKRSQKPKFQCLILKSGQMPEWLEGVELISLGGCAMPSILESPNVGVESSLWQVMESNAPPKYYLSKKACEGIIRRAANRGKTLPRLLEMALLYRIATADNALDPTYSPLGNMNGNDEKAVYGLCSVSSNSMKSGNPNSGIYEADTIRTLDSQGGNPSCNQGGMIVVEKEAKAIHESLSGDSVNISDIAYALRSGRKPLMLEEVRCEFAGFDGYNGEVTGKQTATLGVNCGMSTGRNGVLHTALHPEIAPTLTASAGGTSRPGGGQGSELDYYMAYALQGNMIGRADHNGPQGDGINKNNCFTLNATDQHAVAFFNHTHNSNIPCQGEIASCQTARQHKQVPIDLVVQKHFVDTGMMSIKESEIANTQTARQCKGTTDYCVRVNADKGFSRYNAGEFGTLTHSGGEMGGGSESLIVWPFYIVRRLTPTECERLQGLPDDWTKFGADSDKQIADTPRYQMLGNSVAIPVVQFILRNIAINEAINKAKKFREGVVV